MLKLHSRQPRRHCTCTRRVWAAASRPHPLPAASASLARRAMARPAACRRRLGFPDLAGPRPFTGGRGRRL